MFAGSWSTRFTDRGAVPVLLTTMVKRVRPVGQMVVGFADLTTWMPGVAWQRTGAEASSERPSTPEPTKVWMSKAGGRVRLLTCTSMSWPLKAAVPEAPGTGLPTLSVIWTMGLWPPPVTVTRMSGDWSQLVSKDH